MPFRGSCRRGVAIRHRTPFDPTPGTVNHLLTARLRPDFKRAVAFGLLALAAAVAVHVYGGLRLSSLTQSAVTLGGSAVFVALAAVAVRTASSEMAAVGRARFGDAHACATSESGSTRSTRTTPGGSGAGCEAAPGREPGMCAPGASVPATRRPAYGYTPAAMTTASVAKPASSPVSSP